MEKKLQTDVLIVGAGPTGLSLACQLVRYGIGFVIIDKKEGVTPYSKALGVHARTLEIYEQIGLAKKAVEQGAIAGRARMFFDGKLRGEMNLSDIGEGLSAYPFMLVLEQSKNEQLLYDYLRSHQRDVLWETELESFSQDASGVSARVKSGDGSSQVVEVKYLAGCDGPKSPVRHGLGLEFEGSTFERTFYVADAKIDWNLSHEALNLCLAKKSFLLIFPLKGEKRYRIVGIFPEGFSKDEGDVLYEEIEQRIKEEAKLDLDIHDVEWFSTYKVHSRHAQRFSSGKCFLAGDSAHVHTPAGAQGMNTGIQDAYNLAWKMALVIQGKADDRLLETYNEERLANAKRLLRTTDRMFQFGTGSDWFLEFLRNRVLPKAAKYVLRLNLVKRQFFPLISQIGIHYRRASLSCHAGDADFEIKAGDRMPYLLIDGTSVYDSLQQPGFHLLVFANEDAGFNLLENALGHEFSKDPIDSHLFPLDPKTAGIFGIDQSFTVFLRPDNHIGFVSKETSWNGIKIHLKEFATNSGIGKLAPE